MNFIFDFIDPKNEKGVLQHLTWASTSAGFKSAEQSHATIILAEVMRALMPGYFFEYIFFF